MNDDDLLDESIACLRFHLRREWGDRYPLDVFSRLLAKSIRPQGWTTNTHFEIERHQVKSRRERWPADALGSLLAHGDASGDDFACPIIIVEYEGERRLLDGNHRINRWIAAGDTRLHDVNLHTITGPAVFVELPAAAKGA